MYTHKPYTDSDTTIILCEQHAEFICIFHDNTFYSSTEEIPTIELKTLTSTTVD